MLVFKAQYLAKTLMHPVLCLQWKKEKGNTDWVQAEVDYCCVCYDDYGKFGCYNDTYALFFHVDLSMFNKGEDHLPIRCH